MDLRQKRAGTRDVDPLAESMNSPTSHLFADSGCFLSSFPFAALFPSVQASLSVAYWLTAQFSLENIDGQVSTRP
jgi:hypothetical protein